MKLKSILRYQIRALSSHPFSTYRHLLLQRSSFMLHARVFELKSIVYQLFLALTAHWRTSRFLSLKQGFKPRTVKMLARLLAGEFEYILTDSLKRCIVEKVSFVISSRHSMQATRNFNELRGWQESSRSTGIAGCRCSPITIGTSFNSMWKVFTDTTCISEEPTSS